MKRNSNIYHLLFALVIVIACFYYSYTKLVPKFKEDRANLALIQLELKAINNKKASLQNSQQSISELGNIVDQMLVAVPEDKDAPNLITELEAIAIKYQVQLPTIQILDSAQTTIDGTLASDNIIPVTFTASGSFSDIHQFVGAIEKDIRFMNIKNLTLSSVGDYVSLNLELDAYKRNNTSLSSSLLFNNSSSLPSLDATNNSSVEVTQ